MPNPALMESMRADLWEQLWPHLKTQGQARRVRAVVDAWAKRWANHPPRGDREVG